MIILLFAGSSCDIGMNMISAMFPQPGKIAHRGSAAAAAAETSTEDSGGGAVGKWRKEKEEM